MNIVIKENTKIKQILINIQMAGKGKGKGKGGRGRSTSRSTRAGITFPVGRVARYLK